MNLPRSIGKTVAATTFVQVYAQFTTIGLQLVILPVLLKFWGTTVFTDWLILSSIPNYLSFTDLGLSQIAKVKIAAYFAESDFKEANEIFKAAFGTIVVMGSLAFIVLVLASVFLFSPTLIGLAATDRLSLTLVLGLLSINFLLYQVVLLYGGVMSSVGQIPQEVAWGANARFADGLSVMVAAALGYGIIVAATLGVVIKIMILWMMIVRMRGIVSWLNTTLRGYSILKVTHLLPASMGYTLASLLNQMLIHIPVFILGYSGMSTYIISFVAMRTLTRTGVAAGGVISHSFFPHYSILYGTKKFETMGRMIKWHAFILLAILISYATTMYFLGPIVMGVWTRNAVEVLEPCYTLLIAAACFEIIWAGLYGLLASTNLHIEASIVFIVITSTVLVLMFHFQRNLPLGMVAFLIAICHAVMAISSFVLVKFRLLGKSIVSPL